MKHALALLAALATLCGCAPDPHVKDVRERGVLAAGVETGIVSDTTPGEAALGRETTVTTSPPEATSGPHGDAPLTLADKLGLYLDHFERDHLGNPAWKNAFESKDIAVYAALAALAGASTTLDTEIKHHYENHKPFGDFVYVDDYLVVGYPFATAALTLLAPPSGFDQRYDDLATFTEVLLANGIVGEAIKISTSRLRPNGSHHDSLPSMHAMLGFATATYIHKTWGKKYGPVVSVPAFVLAGLTAYPRLEREKHYLSDVLAGAAISVFLTNVICDWHYSQDGINSDNGVTVGPFVTPDGATGIAVNVSF